MYPLFNTTQQKRNHGPHPNMDKSFFSSQKYPDCWLWDQPSFLFKRKPKPFHQGQSSCAINLTIHLHMGLNHYSPICYHSAVLKDTFIKKSLLRGQRYSNIQSTMMITQYSSCIFNYRSTNHMPEALICVPQKQKQGPYVLSFFFILFICLPLLHVII